MNNLNSAATEVFQILRSFDYAVKMWDEEGQEVFNPEEARRLFATPDNIQISILDDNDNSSINLYIGKSIEVEEVLGLIESLRNTAPKYNMLFHVQKLNREIKPKDFSPGGAVAEGRTSMNQLTEGMYGTSRSSYLKLENARMIVRHSAKIDENIMGSRGRHIDSIFVENAAGERFLMPTQQLAPARAMVQHINQGGGVADEVGLQIARMAQDFRNLGTCSQYIFVNSGRLAESAMELRGKCREKLSEMRKAFTRLAKESTYADEAECVRCEEEAPLAEAAVVESLRSLLTLEGREISEAVLNTVATAVAHGSLNEAREAAVEMTSVLGMPVSKEAFAELTQGKIALRASPEIDTAASFRDVASEAMFKYNAVVAQVMDHSLQTFLELVGEKLAHGATGDLARKLNMIVRATMKAAGVSMDAGISTKNAAVREFIEWFQSQSPEAILGEDADEDTEEMMDGNDDVMEEESEDGDEEDDDTVEESAKAQTKWYVDGREDELFDSFEACAKRYPRMKPRQTLIKPKDIEQKNEGIFDSSDKKMKTRAVRTIKGEKTGMTRADALAYLKKIGASETLSEDAPMSAEYDLTEDAMGGATLTRLSDGADVYFQPGDDAEHAKDNLLDSNGEVDAMTAAEYFGVNEDTELRREDVLLPKDQGKSLKSEVTAKTMRDPGTGKEVPADNEEVNKLMANAGLRSRLNQQR